MMTRFALSSLLAMLITFGLFWGMQYLISTGANPTEGRIMGQRIAIGEMRTILDITPKIRKPQRPTPVPTPSEDLAENLDFGPKAADNLANPMMGHALDMGIGNVPFNGDVQLGGFGGMGGFSAGDGDYMPIMKVAPLYPRRAAEQGISGYVILAFTVTKHGTVTDVKVVETTNSLFNHEAIKAAERFKYKPRTVDGVAVDVAGILHKITFELEQ